MIYSGIATLYIQYRFLIVIHINYKIIIGYLYPIFLF